MPYVGHVTIATETLRRPSFTIGDRLRKARTLLGSDMDVKAFAELLGVGRNTITNYELEKTSQDRMKVIVLRQWALATGVDYDWLLNGDGPQPGGPGAEMGPPPGIEPGTYSLRVNRSAD